MPMNDYLIFGLSTFVSSFLGILIFYWLKKRSLPLSTRLGASIGGGAAGSFGGMILENVYHLSLINGILPVVPIMVGTLLSVSFQKYMHDYLSH